MDPQLSVQESHDVTEKIEDMLRNRFEVFDTDIHVEPFDEGETTCEHN